MSRDRAACGLFQLWKAVHRGGDRAWECNAVCRRVFGPLDEREPSRCTGNLRCILTKVSDSDYNADFHATWHGFASEHSVVLHTKPAARKKSGAGLREFEGTSALRTLIGAGTYTCKGTVDPHGMQACYDATYDRGGFQMSRVRSGAALR